MKEFGVGINLKKSVIAKNASFEFAKVSYSKGKIVSPISWKMFISQNSQIGRVNILYHLLKKRVIRKPMRFAENVVRKSLYQLGSINFSLVSLLSMMINSGQMTYSDLLRTIIVPDKRKKRDLSTSINFLNKEYLRSLIISLVRGQPIPLRQSELIAQVAYNDLP